MNVILILGACGSALVFIIAVAGVLRAIFRQVNAVEQNTKALDNLTEKIDHIAQRISNMETRIAILEDWRRGNGPAPRP